MEWQVIAWIFILLSLILSGCLFYAIYKKENETESCVVKICEQEYDIVEIRSVKTITPQLLYFNHLFPGYKNSVDIAEVELAEEILNEVKKHIEITKHESPSDIITLEGNVKVGIRRN